MPTGTGLVASLPASERSPSARVTPLSESTRPTGGDADCGHQRISWRRRLCVAFSPSSIWTCAALVASCSRNAGILPVAGDGFGDRGDVVGAGRQRWNVVGAGVGDRDLPHPSGLAPVSIQAFESAGKTMTATPSRAARSVSWTVPESDAGRSVNVRTTSATSVESRSSGTSETSRSPRNAPLNVHPWARRSGRNSVPPAVRRTRNGPWRRCGRAA